MLRWSPPILLSLALAHALFAQGIYNGDLTVIGKIETASATNSRPLKVGHAAPASGDCDEAIAVTGATNATPIVITATSHGLSDFDIVTIFLVAGNAAANGTWMVGGSTTNTFQLCAFWDGSSCIGPAAGSGAYTSGGVVSREVGRVYFRTGTVPSGENVYVCGQTTGTPSWVRMASPLAPYILATGTNATLPNARTIGVSTGLAKDDQGAGAGYVLSFDYTSTLASAASLTTKLCVFDGVDAGGGLICEGATDNGFETLLTLADPSADRTITLPNETGTVCTTGSVCAGYTGALSGTTGTLPKFTSATAIGNSLVTEGTNAINVTSGTTATELRWLEPSGSGTNYTGWKAGAQTTNPVYIWPLAGIPATKKVLASDNAGQTTWEDVAFKVGSVGAGRIASFDSGGDLVDAAEVTTTGVGVFCSENANFALQTYGDHDSICHDRLNISSGDPVGSSVATFDGSVVVAGSVTGVTHLDTASYIQAGSNITVAGYVNPTVDLGSDLGESVTPLRWNNLAVGTINGVAPIVANTPTVLPVSDGSGLVDSLLSEDGTGGLVFNDAGSAPAFYSATGAGALGTSSLPWNIRAATITVTGLVDGVDVSTHDHSSSTAQTRLAAKDRRRSITYRVDTALGLAVALGELAVGKVGPEAATHTACWYTPDAALTASDTNYRTLTVSKRTSAGATKTTLYSVTTKITGGTGNWTAFAPVSLGTVANSAEAADGSVTFESSITGLGVALPTGTLTCEYTTD